MGSLSSLAGTEWLTAFLLMSVRATAALALSPPLASLGTPAVVRIVLIFGLASLAVSPVPGSALPVVAPDDFPMAVMVEAVTGMLLGLGIHVATAVFAVAGRLLDVQIGFGIGSLYDPVTRSSQNAMGALTSLLGVTLFFLVDAHLVFATLLAESAKIFPLGRWPALDNPLPMLSAAGTMFSLGLALAAPVVLALVLVDLGVGAAARNMPQINLLVLGIPLKVIIAFFVLAVSVRAWSPLVHRIFELVTGLLGVR